MSTFQVKLESSAALLKTAVAAGVLGKDKVFVESLLESYSKYGSLSPKQEFWFHKMADKYASGAPTVAPAEVSAPAPVPASIAQFEGVYALFLKAKEKLKFPKINLQLADGSAVVLNISGPKSKKPGIINVTNGGKFKAPGSKWYGRVNPDGTMESFSGADSLFPEFAEVKALLKELAASPAVVAAKHGKLSGACCFCNKTLTDKDHSTAVGYGPVCAKNYGLYAEWKAGENLFESLAKVEPMKFVASEEGHPISVEAAQILAAEKAISGLDNEALKAVGLKPVEEKVNDKLKALSEALISPAKAAKVAKAAVVSVPEPKKDEDYLF
jgi:hypothetical protein